VDSLLILSSQGIDPAVLPAIKLNLYLYVVQVSMLYGPEFSGLENHMLKHLVPQGIEIIYTP
jgi:hypothetical protein